MTELELEAENYHTHFLISLESSAQYSLLTASIIIPHRQSDIVQIKALHSAFAAEDTDIDL